MVKLSSVLAGVAAVGLMAAGPAMAQTRAADSLPAATVVVDPAAVDRSASPIDDASELGRRSSPLLILLLLGAIAAVILIASGGGNGNDSPG
jgi:hypothetical protein